MNVQRAGCFPLTTLCFEDLFVLALFLGLWTRRQMLFDRVMLPSASCHYQADSTSQFFFVQGMKSCRVVDPFFVLAFRVVMLFFSEVKKLIDTSRLSSSYGHMEYIALHVNTQSIRYASLSQHFWLLQGDGKLFFIRRSLFWAFCVFFFILTIKK